MCVCLIPLALWSFIKRATEKQHFHPPTHIYLQSSQESGGDSPAEVLGNGISGFQTSIQEVTLKEAGAVANVTVTQPSTTPAAATGSHEAAESHCGYAQHPNYDALSDGW